MFPVIYDNQRYQVPPDYIIYLLQYRIWNKALLNAGVWNQNPCFAQGVLSSVCYPDISVATKISLHKSDEWEKEAEWRLFCTRYQALSEYIKIFEEDANITNDLENLDQPYVNNKLQILSPSYFQASLKSLKSDPKKLFDWNDYDFYATSETNIDDGIRYCDGSTEYDVEVRNRSLNDVNDAARNYSSGNVYQLEDFNELSKNYCGFLIDMLDYFNENDIEVTFFLPPYHPYVYETLSNSDKYGIINDVEIYLRALANERNIKVYGSYNPDKVNCKDADFLDGMHMKRNQIYKAWQVVN